METLYVIGQIPYQSLKKVVVLYQPLKISKLLISPHYYLLFPRHPLQDLTVLNRREKDPFTPVCLLLCYTLRNGSTQDMTTHNDTNFTMPHQSRECTSSSKRSMHRQVG
jgi:hypothetical protein